MANVLSLNPLPYLGAMLNPFVAVGIVLLVLGLLIRLAALSVADLTYVLPLTASGYIISSILGWLVLKEQIGFDHWIGILLIFAGTVLVGSTSVHTTRALEQNL